MCPVELKFLFLPSYGGLLDEGHTRGGFLFSHRRADITAAAYLPEQGYRQRQQGQPARKVHGILR
ncbi:MAG: hypothetical protein AB7K24_10560 [Gemmataceae bacterium]